MRTFVQQTFASLVGSLLGLIIFSGIGTTGLFLLLFAAASSKDTGPEVKDKSMIVFDLSMNITDGEPKTDGFIEKVVSGVEENRMGLRSVLDTLEKARRDPRIVGIYLDASQAGSNGAGYASLKEIRQELQQFRAAGKKVIAYGKDWDEKDYYLSSVADTVVLNPLGMMEVNGLSSQPMFLAGALEKYGIGVQVVRVGKFKGAVEPFILKQLSPENREQTQKLLDDVWREWRVAVGGSRKMGADKLQAIADNQAVLEAPQAKSNGLVDRVAYLDEVVSDLKKLTDSDKDDKTFRQISLSEYAQVPGKTLGVERKSKNKIAVVYAEGEIVDGKGGDGEVGGDRYAKIFNKLRQDDDIKAVILRVNSPGGSATAAEVMQREVRLTRQVKPVVVSMGDVAASGGYWIASDSNRIFAEPNTITGSIGVFGLLFNGQKLANDHGVTWDSVKTGRYADSQTVSRPKSPEELALYQRSVNRIYNMFLNKVSQGRKLPGTRVAEIAQGRVWSGTAAKEIGLVDEIGGLSAAIEYAAKQAKLGKDWQVKEYPQNSSFEERFFGISTQEARSVLGIPKAQVKQSNPLTAEFAKLQEELSVMQKMNDPQGVYARLPFNLKIE
ncbi:MULTISPECIES: signal peptide peptidase SppA [unclassified Tolypothrix]|uniref:signal peptide peptidase SppA n=1 Tax=unclassified Tolypothrix TaxID=2649714 RepID=UPI0005EAAC82|nr:MULTISPECIES: signal peptide peptidase SppA [unclassified Tolypothrix]BAY92770.1 signal peptide peptidase SppA, 67K type [Microchaete diplosiphon NIES-3275]EKF04588.1 signal peptide peptidase SppA [Tolypothrix sp. PCC 7601]MBE9081524.1 signal peptide peptidase SppA [Tolypothrix sp. LEGE 11397]UYD26690.1 signal peptide peptidase SppA [Tolypothrix sp. PCC 7712]UYD37449.1 signal peptide peptidase SppA [Tolypothrix sp. PCC 7601]